VRRHLGADGQLRSLPQKAAGTAQRHHPSLAVAELCASWSNCTISAGTKRGKITIATLSYTNHPLLPERWKPGRQNCSRSCCRGTGIIYRINGAHLALAEAKCPGDVDYRARSR